MLTTFFRTQQTAQIETKTELENMIILIPFQALMEQTCEVIKNIGSHVKQIYFINQHVDSVPNEERERYQSYFEDLKSNNTLDTKINTTKKLLSINSTEKKDTKAALEELEKLSAEYSEQDNPVLICVMSENTQWLAALIKNSRDYTCFKIRAIALDPAKHADDYLAQIKQEISAKEDKLSLPLVISQYRLTHTIAIINCLSENLSNYLGEQFYKSNPENFSSEAFASAIKQFYNQSQDNSLFPLAFAFSNSNSIWKKLNPLFECLQKYHNEVVKYYEILRSPGFVLTPTILSRFINPLMEYLRDFLSEFSSFEGKTDDMLFQMVNRTQNQLKLFKKELEIESNAPETDLAIENEKAYALNLLSCQELHWIDDEKYKEIGYKYLYESLKQEIEAAKKTYKDQGKTKPMAETILPQVLRDLDVSNCRYSYREKFLILGGALIKEHDAKLAHDEKNKSRLENPSIQLELFKEIIEKYFNINPNLATIFNNAFKEYQHYQKKYFYNRYCKIIEEIKSDVEMEDESEISVSSGLTLAVETNEELDRKVPKLLKAEDDILSSTFFEERIKEYVHDLLINPETHKNDDKLFLNLAYEYLYWELEKKITDAHNKYKAKQKKSIKAFIIERMINDLQEAKCSDQEKFYRLLGAVNVQRDRKQARHDSQSIATITKSDQVAAYADILKAFPNTKSDIFTYKQFYWYYVRNIKVSEYFLSSLNQLLQSKKKESRVEEQEEQNEKELIGARAIPLIFINWSKRVSAANKTLDVEKVILEYAFELLEKPSSHKSDDPRFIDLAYQLLFNELKKQLYIIHDSDEKIVEISRKLAEVLEKLNQRNYSAQEKFEILAGALSRENKNRPSTLFARATSELSASIPNVSLFHETANKNKKDRKEKRIYDPVIERLKLSINAANYSRAYNVFNRDLRNTSYFIDKLKILVDAAANKEKEKNTTKKAEIKVEEIIPTVISTLSTSNPPPLPPRSITSPSSHEVTPAVIVAVPNATISSKAPSFPARPPALKLPLKQLALSSEFIPQQFQCLILSNEEDNNISENVYLKALESYFSYLSTIKSTEEELNQEQVSFRNITYEYKFNAFLYDIYAACDSYEREYKKLPESFDLAMLVDLTNSDKSFEIKYKILAGAIIKRYTELCQEKPENNKIAVAGIRIFGTTKPPESITKEKYKEIIEVFVPEGFRAECLNLYEEYKKQQHSHTVG